jgi:putative type I site-specific restriction-modification system, S subunit
MRRYESYKDSGVEWLRQIPSHWDMQRSKFIFKKIERKVNEEDQIVTCFRDGQVTLRANRRTEGFTNALKEHGYQGIRKGDLVIHAMDAFAGAIGVSDSDGKATPVYSVCLPHDKQKIDVYFYAYYLRNLALSGFISSLAKGIRERSTDFRYADFAELLLPIPPYLEQQKVAQFLDDKTAKIDQAVDLAEKQIALLKEHKQILIQNAVTRGLNPDVPLKDSGVEWIGQVPEHWEVVSMKRVVKEHSGNGFPIDLQGNNGNIPFLKVSDFSENQDKYIFKWNNSVTNKVIKQKKWNIVPKNSIVTAKIGEALRKNHRKILSIDSIIDNNCLGIEIKKADVLFGYYLHCALDFDLFTNPGAIPSLAMDKYRNQKIVLPPFQEQQEIADYLEQQIAKINQAIALKTAHIEKLKEYKSVLINDVVTGKVRV